MDQVNLRTTYTTGKAQGGVLTFWNPPAVDNGLWAAAVVQRVAKRVHWTPPDDVAQVTTEATEEADPKKQAELWVEWQKRAGRPGQPFHPVPAGLSDRRAQDDRQAAADGGGLEARHVRGEAA